MNNKIAFFDFCETVVNFQTADRFVEFCLNENKQYIPNHFLYKIFKKANITRIMAKILSIYSINKRLKLYTLKGISFERLDFLAQKYYIEELQPALILPVISEIVKKKEDGYKVWIISGGYDLYIKYFIEDYKLNGQIATKIGFDKNNICTGSFDSFDSFDSIDCIGKNKVKLVKEKIQDIDTYKSVFYSDSKSDIPLLKFCTKGIVVSKNKSRHWVAANNLEEIIWD
jgi:HAD superfamily phosphoserine phosphatase-like hydrolase